MSLFAELQRRNVVRVAIAYAVIGWVIAQIAEFAFENFGAPDWVLKSVVVVLLLGLPLALVFAWAFELTPDGVRREKDVDRSKSITPQTGRKLDRAIIVGLVVALAWFAWDKFASGSRPDADPVDVVAAVRPATDKSVAVLPFVAMSSGPDEEYFADGLTEEILNSLAQLPELLVTARTSAFAFKGQDKPVQEIAAALGVKHIVEGSVRRGGERLRVTAQLIRASDGFHLWSENYDSTSTDTIAVQENIAEQIASAMNVVLDDNKLEAMRKAGLRDVEAFTLYQKGLDFFNRAHGASDQTVDLRQANAVFDQVIARVPDFGEVYALHADLYSHMLTDYVVGLRSPDASEEDIANAYPAMIADYEAAVRHASSPTLRQLAEFDLAFLSGNWRGLAERLRLALEAPGCTDSNWINTIAAVAGYAARLRQRNDTLLACDPLRSLAWFNTARAALWAGDKDAALQISLEGTQLAPGNWLNMNLVRTLVALGRFDEAEREIDSRFQNLDMTFAFKALVAAQRGDRQQFDRLFKQYEAEFGERSLWHIILRAWSGNRSEANRLAAIVDQHQFGPVTLWQLAHWCACGAPWDLEATPNFAARIADSGIAWPPPSPLSYTLKDW